MSTGFTRSSLDRVVALQVERTDAVSWLDGFAAAPPGAAAALGLACHDESGLIMVRSHIPFSRFNRVMTLGCPAPVSKAAFARIERFYAAVGGTHGVLLNDHSEPQDLAGQLLARGYRAADAWDRVMLRGVRPELWRTWASGCELVRPHNRHEWAAFVRGACGMPPAIGELLLALVGRPGWLHMVRRQGGRAAAPVVRARSLFRAADGWCWLGISASASSVMASSVDDDQRVTAALLMAVMEEGGHSFVSDIEPVDPQRAHPGPSAWAELGFAVGYQRRLFRKG